MSLGIFISKQLNTLKHRCSYSNILIKIKLMFNEKTRLPLHFMANNEHTLGGKQTKTQNSKNTEGVYFAAN